MDPVVVSIISFITMIAGLWAGYITLMFGRIIFAAQKKHGRARFSDKLWFFSMLLGTIAAFVIVFIWPGLIYMIPSTIAFVEIGSIPVFLYLTERCIKIRQLIENSTNDAKLTKAL